MEHLDRSTPRKTDRRSNASQTCWRYGDCQRCRTAVERIVAARGQPPEPAYLRALRQRALEASTYAASSSVRCAGSYLDPRDCCWQARSFFAKRKQPVSLQPTALTLAEPRNAVVDSARNATAASRSHLNPVAVPRCSSNALRPCRAGLESCGVGPHAKIATRETMFLACEAECGEFRQHGAVPWLARLLA